MALNQEQLNRFREQKERLGSMLSDSAEVISELNMTSASENWNKLSEQVSNDTFKIQVIGTFKNGKSTFINSLLGESVLPAYALPCTAVINEVKYGEEKEAILHFRNPLPEKLPESISPKAMSHMQAHGMENVPPLKIGYDEIEDYVCIPMGSDPTEMLLESPYEKVELFWPLDMLKEGVEIIDSPGLNEAETRTRVTMDYLAKADAILFVLNAIQLCSMDEMNFIENNLKAYGFTDPFFVVNRYDLIPDSQKEGIKKFAEIKLAEYSTNQIFYVSAQQALDGAMNNNEALYGKSNMGEFTKVLSDFLTKDKGKIKLSQPARELKRILNNEALYKVIPGQRTMLDSSLDDVKSRYEKAKPQLETLKSKKEQIITKLNLRIEQSRHEFQRAINKNTLAVAEMIPGWIETYTPKKSISMLHPKESAKAVGLEITDYVTKQIEEQQNKWRSTVMMPLANERAQYIFESTEQDLTRIYAEIDNINIYVSGNNEVDPNTVPLWQRIAGVAGGVLLHCPDVAIAGGMNGITSDLIKNLALVLGTEFALTYLVGAFNPIVLVGGIVVSLLAGGGLNSNSGIKKIKQALSQQYVDSICKSAEDTSVELSSKICQQLSDMSADISTAIDEEINNVEQQVNGIIKEMEKGKASIDARKKVLDSCETKIKGISSDLDAFTFELIEQK